MKPAELGELIRERIACNNARSLLGQFKIFVEDIFGYQVSNDLDTFSTRSEYCDNRSNPLGWNLKGLLRSQDSAHHEAVLTFLHPEGLFFSLIKSLMTETSAKFEYPVSQFPPYFRSMIENGSGPPFFANKILSTSYNTTSNLILNPFEFYIFHFGIYILNNNSNCYDTVIAPNDEPAYFTLLKIYLDYFVPLDAPHTVIGDNIQNQQPTIWQSLSNKTSNLLNLASGSNPNQSSSSIVSSSGQYSSSLFKPSIFQPQSPYNQNLSSSHHGTPPGPILYGQGEHIRSVEWRCSTLLLMLTELWFGNIPAPKTNYILKSTNLDDLSVASIQPYSANIDQMTAVRIVIKHLHYFSNSFTYNPMSHTVNQGLAEIKQVIWTSKYPLQKRLYTFIKVAFQRWPMDYTFRQPLEAWLSYIQPWRYVKPNNERTTTSHDLEDHDVSRGPNLIDVPFIDNHWRNFISDNLLYYTNIFSVLIDRLLQLDLSSSRNALMLYRVIKVYSQPGFLNLLKEAEESVMRNNLEMSMSKSSGYRNNNTSAASGLTTMNCGGPNMANNTSNHHDTSFNLIQPSPSTPSSQLLSNRASNSDLNSGLFQQQQQQHQQQQQQQQQTTASSRISAAKSLTPVFLSNGKISHPKSRMGALEHHLMNLESDTSLFAPQMKQKLTKLLADVHKSRLSIKDFVQSVEVRSRLRSRGWLDSLRAFISMEDGFESRDEREMYRDKMQADDYLNFVIYHITDTGDLIDSHHGST